MTPKKRIDPKAESLRRTGALNRHPEKVADPAFLSDDFFDPQDLVQVKYELVRRVRIDGIPVSSACAVFGLTRPVFYKTRTALDREGLPGLIPKKPGPRRRHKLTAEVLQFLEEERERDRSLRPPVLARLVKERFGVVVHPRTIERVLRGLEKKRL